MRKLHKNYTPVEKVAILRRHLIDRVPVLSLLRRLVIGERIEVVDENRSAYRELAAAIPFNIYVCPSCRRRYVE